MKQLPVAARLYVIAVCVAGALVGAYFAPHSVARPGLFIALLVCSSVASALKVSLPLATSGSTMSISYAVDFAALLLLGADETMVVAATSAWSQCTFRTQSRAAIYRTLFSMASLVLTVKAAGLAYVWLGGLPPDQMLVLAAIPKPLVGAATMYFVCNTALIATAIGLSTKQGIVRVWNENFLWSAPSYFVGALAAAAAAWVIQRGGYWTALLTSMPVYLLYRTYKVYLGRVQDEQRHVQEVSDLHLATIEALALAIDAKDQTAQSHIRRVQVYAAGIARALGMAEHEIQGVKTAALLHDIGKLAVPEHILSKPGPLTQEEFQKIRIHPQVGAEIISGVPFPYPVAPLILSHHERWDGKGYPAGSKGDEIPLGARILSVVDYFDALMSERPYHKAMSFDAAIGLLRQESGKALDPRVVTTFIEMYPALAAEADASQAPARKLTRVAAHAPAAQPAAGLLPESTGRKNVFEDIALAHREIYALYEIAQAMGSSLGVADTMALISSKLSNIVPFSCCALFLYNEDNETLRCRFATGVQAEQIQQLTIRSGQGLTGWVARNRRPLVNARPSADLEAAGVSWPTTLQSALVCPLVFNDRFIGTISVYHVERVRLHRRPSPPARSHLRTGRRRHLQLDRVRADAGRLADRSADGPAEHAVHVHAPHARARPRRAPEAGSVAARDGPRQLQGHQRHLRASRGRPRAARGRGRAADRHPSLRHLRPVRRRRVHRRPLGMRQRGSRAQAARAAGGRGPPAVRGEARASCSRSPSASAHRSSRTTATRTRRCSPRPTAACTATRRGGSAARWATARATTAGPAIAVLGGLRACRTSRSSNRRRPFRSSNLLSPPSSMRGFARWCNRRCGRASCAT